MLEHDPGVGGRFSVLTNVGLLPAAALGLDIDAIRDGAAMALAPVLDKRAPADVPAAVGAALVGRARQADRGDDGLCRPARALHALVRAALGRKPRQGRQGHDADRRARAGRSAQPAAAVHRGTARQAVHRHHHRRRRPRPAHRGRARAGSRASPTSPARPSATSSPRRAAPPPRRWRRTAARCAPSTSSGSTRQASASC